MDENISEESIEDEIKLEAAEEQKAEYFEPVKRKI